MKNPLMQTPWQAVAIELIRRRAGAKPLMSNEELKAAAGTNEFELLTVQMDDLYFKEFEIDDHPRQRLYQLLWDVQAEAATSVLTELTRGGAVPYVFKGIEIAARYDGRRGMGVRNDVDLLLPLESIWEARRVLYGMGYQHIEYDWKTGGWIRTGHIEAARREASSYELVPLVRSVRIDGVDARVRSEAARFPHVFATQADELTVFVRFDIHHNILFRFNVAPLLQRGISSALGVGRTLSPSDHLWFAIHRYYTEVATGNSTRPRVLALIAAIVNDPEVDWDIVVGNAVGQGEVSPCLHWLTFFWRLGAPRVPEHILAELRSHCRRRAGRNWGWQLGRLFDLDEPFPETLLTLAPSSEHSEV